MPEKRIFYLRKSLFTVFLQTYIAFCTGIYWLTIWKLEMEWEINVKEKWRLYLLSYVHFPSFTYTKIVYLFSQEDNLYFIVFHILFHTQPNRGKAHIGKIQYFCLVNVYSYCMMLILSISIKLNRCQSII